MTKGEPAAIVAQRGRWEGALTRPERYGDDPSAPAVAAAECFDAGRVREVLELGAGQGRDTIFFARRGFEVCALDFAEAGIRAIREKAAASGVTDRVRAVAHDVREPLPFPDDCFDACYSHMLFCMALTERELRRLSAEVWRVLRANGFNVYTVRTTADPDYGKGVYHGEHLYESDGFVVHFFDRGLIERLADGYDVLGVDRYQGGSLPRDLFGVALRRRESAPRIA